MIDTAALATGAAKIVETDGRSTVLDLSAGSRLAGQPIAGLDTVALGNLIEQTMAAAGTGFAFGRYAEPRELYTNDLFDGGAERRTIHMGIDLFCQAGTPVHAPLHGTVELLANNAQELDYGPVLVLRHTEEDGREFFLLLGHLGAEVLDSLAAGDAVSRGQAVATVGAPPGNGNWPPHLHAQLILDLQGLGADFPGVAEASRRDHWLGLSPSPAAFFPEWPAAELEYPSCN